MNTKVSGKIKFKEYLQIAIYDNKKASVKIIITLIIAIYIIIPQNTPPVGVLLYYTLGPIWGMILHFLFVFIRNLRSYNSLSERFHEKIVQLNNEGIQYGNKGNQIFYQWSDIKKSVFLRKIIFLYTNNNRVIVIPKHFFSSLEEEKEWTDFIKSHLPN